MVGEKPLKKAFTVAVLTLILSASTPWLGAGTKEEIIRLSSDVLQLQNQVLNLQKSFDERQGSVQSLLEQLNDQVATTNRVLQEMVVVMRAQNTDWTRVSAELGRDVEGLSVKLDETNNRLAALFQKVEESQLRSESRRLPSSSDPGGPKPDQVYSLAFNDYLAGNYELAVDGFRDFLVRYPESEYADNAAYYLGLCLQQLGQQEQAVQAFDQVINMYPQADMTAAAYYKKALVQQELLKNEEAIATFQKLVRLFPDSQEATTARQELENLGVRVPSAR